MRQKKTKHICCLEGVRKRAHFAGQAAPLPLLPSLNILFNSCLETSHRGDLNALMFDFFLAIKKKCSIS